MTLIPTRLLVMQRLTALLEGPLEIDGTDVDLAGKVSRGRNIVGEESRGTALSILEAPRPDFAIFAGNESENRKDNLTLLIQGRVEDDKLYPCDKAYYLAAAVQVQLTKIIAEKRPGGPPLYPELYMLGNLITSLEVMPAVVRPPEDKVSASAFFFLVVRIGIAEVVGQPYTQVL